MDEEKGVSSGNHNLRFEEPSDENHKHQHLHTGKRLRQFLHPDGRRRHIATSPEEAEILRRTTSESGDEEVVILIHGTAEHIDALRETQTHHEGLRTNLRNRNAEIYDEAEKIHKTLDELSEELHIVTDHAVQLDANFSKYGYSANIRTHTSPSDSKSPSRTNSRTNSIYGDSQSSNTPDDWKKAKYEGESIKFYTKPLVRQYLHKGLLWRASETTEVGSYELFVDLLYVGIVGIAGDSAAEDASANALLRFAVTFIMAWRFWSEMTQWMAWFEADDVIRRLSVLFILASLLGFTTNIVNANTTTYTPLVAFYLANKFFNTIYYAWYAYLLPMIRTQLVGNALISTLSCGLWIGSIYIDDWTTKQALIWPAIFFDLYGGMMLMLCNRWGRRTKLFGAWLEKHVEFVPAMNIEHRIERTGAFVTLIFGYSIVAILFQGREASDVNAFFGKAVLGLMQAFIFNTLYFEADNFNLHTHAIRRHVVSSMIWISIHLPFVMSYVLAGAALSRLVLAHDCVNSNVDILTDQYAAKSEPEISNAVRWFYCAGLGISLLCMGVISLCHSYKVVPGARIQSSKPLRIAARSAVAIVIIFLGFTELNSLQLVGTVTALLGPVLGLELAFDMACDYKTECCMSKKKISFFQRFCGGGSRQCKYSARCNVSKKDLEASIKNGTVLRTEELKGEKGIMCPG